jgi:hypothetical protein
MQCDDQIFRSSDTKNIVQRPYRVRRFDGIAECCKEANADMSDIHSFAKSL